MIQTSSISHKLRLHIWPILLLCLLTLAALAFYLQTELAYTGGRLGAPLDDTWIHFQFARNLSQGYGFSYNPGEPQPGSTAPLWTLLLAGVGLFTQEFLLPAIVLSTMFLLLTVVMSYGFAVWLTCSRWAGFLAGLGVALAGRLLWAGLAGMETTAFAALSVTAVWLYAVKGLRPSTAFLFGLASQMRPEGHALFGLALFDWLLANHQLLTTHWKGLLRQLALPLLVYLIVCLPYTLFSLSVTGHPLPNTFYVKVGSEQFFSLRTFRKTVSLHWADNPITMILAVVGLFPTWKRSRLTVLWLVGFPLLAAVTVDEVWHHGRYTMPLIPFQMIVAAVGVHWLVTKAEKWLGQEIKEIFPLRYAAFLLFCFLAVAGASWHFHTWATMLAHNVQEILDIDVALGEWLADNTPPDALIAIDDIGAITFLSGRRIVDMNGLVSPEVWPALRQPVGLARDSRLTRILSASQPDYVVAFPLWHWPLTQNRAILQPIHRVQTDTHTIIYQSEALVYEADWSDLGAAQPDTAVGDTFGDAIQLTGYDLAVDGATINLTLYWHSQQSVSANYDVFVHMLADNGNIVAQVDQQPMNGFAPTSLWQPGETIRDSITLSLPSELPAGTYRLITGLYLRETGERLTAVGTHVIDGNVIHLTDLNLGSVQK